jgi:molecular chaperone DnaK
VEQVLAVGGSTRMPQVLEMLKRVVGREADCTLSPDEAVAQGAAIHAAICATTSARRRPPVPAATPIMQIPKPAPIPVTSPPPPPPIPIPVASVVEPKKVIPIPAPIPASGFQAPVADLLNSIHTTNVNAHSLGVVVITRDNRQRVSHLVPHNSALPCAVKKQFGMVRDGQTMVTVRIVEGESPVPEECIPVGACTIDQLPAGLLRGSPVEVTFRYDNSGRLHVEAVELSSGKTAAVAIDRGGGAGQKQRDSEMARHVAQARVS